MRLEIIPVILGALLALFGVLLIADAVIPDHDPRVTERRRRGRPERHRLGEAGLGLGILLAAAALFGGDDWPYTTLAILVALALFVVGLALNYKYFRGRIFGPAFGGKHARRASDDSPPPPRRRFRLR